MKESRFIQGRLDDFCHCGASIGSSVEASDWWVMEVGVARLENQDDMADFALVKAPSND